jgi:hypothetical protein
LRQQPARKNEPDRNLFLRTNTLLDWTDRTLPRNPMLPVNSVLPWIVFTTPTCSPNHLPYAFSIQPPSISVFAPKKLVSFGLLSFTAPAQLVRGHFALLAHPTPPHPLTEWKESASRPLCNLPVFVQYTLSLLNSFVLRSSLCFLGILKTDPNHSSCPHHHPHVGLCRMCAYGMDNGLV